MRTTPNRPPAALWLGVFGAIPFIVLVLVGAFVEPSWNILLGKSLTAYAALILTFLGGIQWGSVMSASNETGHKNTSRYVVSIIPVLISWSSLLTAQRTSFWLLIAGFLLALLINLQAVSSGLLPEWYRQVRIPLSLVVISASVAGAMVFNTTAPVT